MAISWYSFRSERRSKRSRSPKSRDRSQSRDRSRERRDRSRGRGRDSSRDRRPTKSYNERKGLAFNIRISRNYKSFIIRGLFWSQNSRNEESNTLAIFNLYYKTDQDELRRIFERYGKIEVSFRLFWPILVEPVEASGEPRHHTTHFFFQKCNIVNNRRRGQTTAFGFLTFENLDDAREAKEDAHGMEIDGNM